MNTKTNQIFLIALVLATAPVHALAMVSPLEPSGDTEIGTSHGNIDTNLNGNDPIAVVTLQAEGLLAFTLSPAVTPGATITQARLTLTFDPANSTPETVVTIYDLARDFVETEATWNRYSAAQTWAAPGLQPFTDYQVFPFVSTMFVPALGGPVTIDVTPYVLGLWRSGRTRVNFLVRINSGAYYGDSFYARENTNPVLRPHLEIDWSNTTPAITMPADIFLSLNDWNHTPIAVSASAVLPGGSTSGLSYQWTVDQSAPGSTIGTGTIVASSADALFNPDAPGSYVLRFAATNTSTGEGNSGTMTVKVGLRTQHPRLMTGPTDLARMRALAAAKDPNWATFLSDTDNDGYQDVFSDYDAYAMAAAVLNDPARFNLGWAKVAALIYKNGTDSTGGMTTLPDVAKTTDPHAVATIGSNIVYAIALFFDWGYSFLSPGQKADLVSWLNAANTYNQIQNAGSSFFMLRNDGITTTQSMVASVYATWEDNPQIATQYAWVAARWQAILDGLKLASQGGGMGEGTGYGAMSAAEVVFTANMIYNATGEDAFLSSPFFKAKLLFDAFDAYPGNLNGFVEHANIGGDGNRGPTWTQIGVRPAGLILTRRFQGTPEADAWNWVYRQPAVDHDLFWYNAGNDVLYAFAPPTLKRPAQLSYHDPSLGYCFIRSDWDSPDATWIALWAGPHIDMHQHLDQGSFVIYKHRDLAIKSGDYTSFATKPSDVGYYTRTISANNLLIGDPKENFQGFLGWGGCDANGQALYTGYMGAPDGTQDCIPNDGGQRTMDPQPLLPDDAQTFYRYHDIYDVAKIISFDDDGSSVRIVADITNAYSNPRHTPPGGHPKVNKVYRRFVYLRSQDILVVGDTVESTDAGFKKKWLIHGTDQIQVGGLVTPVDDGQELHSGTTEAKIVVNDFNFADRDQTTWDLRSGYSSLLMRTIFPTKMQYRLVGGRDASQTQDTYSGAFSVHHKDFWVQDPSEGVVPNHRSENWPITYTKDGGTADSYPDYRGGYGRWRLEVEPASANKIDYFLNVLKPSLNPAETLPPMPSVETDTLFGVAVPNGSGFLYVMFPKNSLSAPTVSNRSPSPTAVVISGLSNVRVYPNPWRVDKHAGQSITFDGLTVGTTLKLFTLSGREVRELHTDAASLPWDLTNNSGEKVASGIYLYVATDGQGDKARGKLAVIR